MDRNTPMKDNYNATSVNDSFMEGNTSSGLNFQTPFHDAVIRSLFIIFYAVVFATCIVGNTIVLFAIVSSPRLRSMTNFFLANLAVADFCVGVFCVLPNLSTFLSQNWILGNVMCKVYYYVWNVSYTSSIVTLTVISMERYIAIIYPLKTRYIRTRKKLIVTLIVIWIVALLYNIPYLIFYDTIIIVSLNMEYCLFHHHNRLGLKGLSLANIIVWYALPLSVIGFAYIRVSVTMLNTNIQHSLKLQKSSSNGSSKYPYKGSITCDESVQQEHSDVIANERYALNLNDKPLGPLYGKSTGDGIEVQVDAETQRDTVRAIVKKEKNKLSHTNRQRRITGERRKVIRLLVAVVISFALCVLPHQLRVLNYFWNIYSLPYAVDVYFTPISFIILYLNSCLNPILYALFSTNFRKAFRESIICL